MVGSTLQRIRRAFRGPDVAIDLGTAFLRVGVGGRGIVDERASSLRVLPSDGATPTSRCYPVLRHGVISDIGAAAEILEPALRRGQHGWSGPRALVCIPSDASSEERHALFQATRAAGASDVAIIPEPLASAIGAGIDTERARLVLDIGDGITDFAVIQRGEMVSHSSLRVAASDLRGALVEWLRRTRDVELEPDPADKLVRWAYRRMTGDDVDDSIRTAGRRVGEIDHVDLLVRHGEILEAVAPVEERIVDFVFDTFVALPDGLAVEVIESGVCFTGGGALLDRLVGSIRSKTGLTVTPADNPLHAVINGATAMLPVAARTGLWDS